MIAMLLMFVASALARTASWCVDVDVSYTDHGFGNRWAVDEDRPARGFRWAVYMQPLFGSPPVLQDFGYLDQGPPTPGCTGDVTLTNGYFYFLRVESMASVTGNTLYAYDTGVGGQKAVYQTSLFQATQDFDFDVVLPGTTDDRWNHLALAVWALWNHDGAMDQVYLLYEDNASTDEDDQSVLLGGAGQSPNRKWDTAREFGRLVAAYADVNDNYGCNVGFPPLSNDDCKGDTDPFTGPLEKTYMAEAGCDGIAMFYAAMTWNILTPGGGQDCEYGDEWSYDWNLDGRIDAFSGDPKACHGDPFAGGGGFPDPDGSDWLQEVVNEYDGNWMNPDCAGTLFGRSTSYDWMTYFWDLVAVQGAVIPAVWDLWDESDPADWNVSDAGMLPHESIEAAATTIDATWPGFLDKHHAADNHGLEDSVH